MPGVMIVVVPLRAIFAARRVLRRRRAGWRGCRRSPAPDGCAGRFPRRDRRPRAEIVQQREPAGFDDGVHGIEPQPVEAVLAQPVQRILDRKGAHLRHAVVDRAAPRRLRLGEEARRVAAEVISLGTEVVVDHVEEHHQPAQMRFVDQRLEIVGPAIGAVGRVPQHAVIAPVARCRRNPPAASIPAR